MVKCIDTTVLLHATDTNSVLHRRAAEYLKKCAHEPWISCVCYESLTEWAKIITSPQFSSKPLAALSVHAAVDAMLKRREPVILYGDEYIYKRALKLCDKHVVLRERFHEAHLAATALAHGVKTIVTANSAPFQAVRELTVENPFETLFG